MKSDRLAASCRRPLGREGLYQIYSQQVAAAQEALHQAQAAHDGALATLTQLRAIRTHPLALSAQVHPAEGQVEIAQAGVDVAQAALDDLQAEPTPEELAVAEAKVEVARAALDTLEVQRDMLTLRSPIAGTITSQVVQAGEIAQAGATLMTVADLSEMTLTVYVPEDELHRVYIGQDVEIRVDAFPQVISEGHVAHISPRAEFTPRNVQTKEDRVTMVFTVRIRVPNADLRLRPGIRRTSPCTRPREPPASPQSARPEPNGVRRPLAYMPETVRRSPSQRAKAEATHMPNRAQAGGRCGVEGFCVRRSG